MVLDGGVGDSVDPDVEGQVLDETLREQDRRLKARSPSGVLRCSPSCQLLQGGLRMQWARRVVKWTRQRPVESLGPWLPLVGRRDALSGACLRIVLARFRTLCA
jgi:hypothetical protein